MSKAYIAGLVMVCGLSWHMAPASAQTLEDRVQVLEDTLACVTVQKNADGIVTDLFIDGCNVHIRNGMNATDRKNGLGNLIIGYNEAPQYLGQVPNDRSGSHNLVIGAEHIYTQTGGLLAGFRNRLLGPSASVTGGTENTAGGDYASISGGSDHYAGGTSASISGGWRNETQDDYSSISGGQNNHAVAPYTTVCGGFGNIASSEAESLCN